MVDSYGKLVGKYTSSMDPMGLKGQVLRLTHGFFNDVSNFRLNHDAVVKTMLNRSH